MLLKSCNVIPSWRELVATADTKLQYAIMKQPRFLMSLKL